MLGTSANRSASPLIRKLRTQGVDLRICKPISYRKHLRICGKKIQIYRESAKQQHPWDRFLAISKKLRFYGSMYRQIWVDVFIKYNTSLPSSAAMEQVFFIDAAIPTAKRANLTSRNFPLHVAQDDFDDMPSKSSKQIGCRPTKIFYLSLSFEFLALLIVFLKCIF